MNRKLTHFADKLELLGVMLVVFAALRADGGLDFWLPLALTGTCACLIGAALSWLCSQRGQAFRRRSFGTQPPLRPVHREQVLVFPKAS